ncbi:hypothetical protein HYV50_01210 [Candidatus Pacearchaeota archaeon]|nr:hypothetical protein [Candidatus Pacearchaeota archaeon]
MKKRRFVGLILIFIGIALSFVNVGITGAVIGARIHIWYNWMANTFSNKKI